MKLGLTEYIGLMCQLESNREILKGEEWVEGSECSERGIRIMA